jgi:DNA modification methylase
MGESTSKQAPWKSRVIGQREMPVAELTANPANWRRHPETQTEALVGAIEEIGFVVPVIFNQRTGRLVDGHARVEEARKAGMATLPVTMIDLSEDEERIALASLDPLSTLAEMDAEALGALLDDIHVDNPALQTMFDGLAEEVDRLFGGEESAEGNTDDDAVPEVPEEPVSKPGDLWVLGNHRLLCGDATVLADVEKALDGSLADMCFTDSPYNVDYANSAKDRMRGKDRRILNDNLGDGFERFLYDACVNILTVTKGAVYMCMSSSELHTLEKAFAEAGGHWSTFVIWAKNTFTLGRSDYQRQYEPILYGWKKGTDHFWCGARDQGDIWFVNKPVKNDLHPTMKPVELVERAIRNSSKSRDIVLDPFGGSGSTLIACEKTGRQARLVELDPKYVDVICRRWQEFTGKDAILNGDDRTFDEVLSERADVAA